MSRYASRSDPSFHFSVKTAGRWRTSLAPGQSLAPRVPSLKHLHAEDLRTTEAACHTTWRYPCRQGEVHANREMIHWPMCWLGNFQIISAGLGPPLTMVKIFRFAIVLESSKSGMGSLRYHVDTCYYSPWSPTLSPAGPDIVVLASTPAT
jgi:hypothetical protein